MSVLDMFINHEAQRSEEHILDLCKQVEILTGESHRHNFARTQLKVMGCTSGEQLKRVYSSEINRLSTLILEARIFGNEKE